MKVLELFPGLSQSCAEWLSLLSWAQSHVLTCWSKSPEVWVQGGSVPFKCVLSPLSAMGLSSPRGTTLEQEWLV